MPQSAAMNDATLSLDAELEALTERGLARLRSASVNVDAMLADAHASGRPPDGDGYIACVQRRATRD